MSRPAPSTCRTINWPAYNAVLKRRGLLLAWFDPETEWLAGPRGATRGHAVPRGAGSRPATFSDAAIQACLGLKALFGLALRQTSKLVASLPKLTGLNRAVPDFSTPCRRQKGLTVTIPFRQSTGALHLLIDSTGIKAAGEGKWSTRKHGGSRLRQQRKVHLAVDAETMAVRATGVAGSQASDGPMLPELLAQIPAEEVIGQVAADGAHNTRPRHAAIAARRASAVIPTRRNGRP